MGMFKAAAEAGVNDGKRKSNDALSAAGYGLGGMGLGALAGGALGHWAGGGHGVSGLGGALVGSALGGGVGSLAHAHNISEDGKAALPMTGAVLGVPLGALAGAMLAPSAGIGLARLIQRVRPDIAPAVALGSMFMGPAAGAALGGTLGGLGGAALGKTLTRKGEEN